MIRVKYKSKTPIYFRSRDLIHDAAVNMLIKAGARREEVVGAGAGIWSAAAIFAKPTPNSDLKLRASEIIVSTSDVAIANYLLKSKQSNFKAARSMTGETIDLSDWSPKLDMSPIHEGQNSIKLLCGSPMVFKRKEDNRQKGLYVKSVAELDINEAINVRLSRLAKRAVNLSVEPDKKYLEIAKNYFVVQYLKAEENVKVGGLAFPFTLHGSTEDLELAWYAGLGEKTRLGFGALVAAK